MKPITTLSKAKEGLNMSLLKIGSDSSLSEQESYLAMGLLLGTALDDKRVIRESLTSIITDR